MVEVAVLFQSHHKAHRDALVSTIKGMGGSPVAEKSLEEYAAALAAGDLVEIHADLEALKAVLPGSDAGAIKEALTRLEGSAYRIADAIYGQQGT